MERWVKYDYLPACGNAGGILVLWDERKLESLQVVKGEFMVGARFKKFRNGVEWGLGVYTDP